MSVADFLREQDRQTFFVVGSTVGALVGVTITVLVNTGIASPRTGAHSGLTSVLFTFISEGLVTSDRFDSDVGHVLRVLQSIGILLPLFTGLLRFTADDQSDVGEWVTDYLFIGIFGLVLGGLFATLGGIMADTAVILKISLLPVLVTFTLIGFAAMGMLRETDDSTSEPAGPRTTPTNSSEAKPRKDGTENEDFSENESGVREDTDAESKTQIESNSESSGREREKTREQGGTCKPPSSKSTKNRINNNYDDGDPTSEKTPDGGSNK